jgi:hypothetical protein
MVSVGRWIFFTPGGIGSTVNLIGIWVSTRDLWPSGDMVILYLDRPMSPGWTVLAVTACEGGEENMVEKVLMSPKAFREAYGILSVSGESLMARNGVCCPSNEIAEGGVLSLLLLPKLKVAGVLA